MSRVRAAGEPEPASTALHVPHRDREDGGSGDPKLRPPGRIVWLAVGWDMARDQIAQFAPGAVDLGAMRVARWRLVGGNGRLVATPAERGSLWGRAWRLDREAADRLAQQRHPRGIREYVRAVDGSGLEYDVELISAPNDERTGGRTSVFDLGWALRGACEGGLPWWWRRTLSLRAVRAGRCHLPGGPPR